MIVRLKEEITDKTENYAYVCEMGKNYFVYAILNLGSGSDESYMINVWGNGTNHTIYDIPAKYFKVVDNSIPNDWESDSYMHDNKNIQIQSFKEFAHDKYFYSKLLDDEPNTLEIFMKYELEYEILAKSC
jgi:hypothetical protein